MKPYDTELSKEEVRAMFDNIAPAYDRLNHTLSLSVDRIWRRRVVRIVGRLHPRRVLDIMATGTGDLAVMMARSIPEAHIKGVDLSEGMLDVARRKVAARGLEERVTLEAGDAETAVAAAGSVDVVTVAFGVRNFGDLGRGLAELSRALRPGGRIVILEFFDAHDAGFRTALRLVFASGAAPYRGLAVARPAGLRLPAPFGGRISAAGGVPDDSRRGGVSAIAVPGARVSASHEFISPRSVEAAAYPLPGAAGAAPAARRLPSLSGARVRIVPKDVETYRSASADVTLHVANQAAVRCGSKRRRCRSPTTAAKCCATLRDTVTVASGWEGRRADALPAACSRPCGALCRAGFAACRGAALRRSPSRAAAARGRRREKSAGAGCRCRIF